MNIIVVFKPVFKAFLQGIKIRHRAAEVNAVLNWTIFTISKNGGLEAFTLKNKFGGKEKPFNSIQQMHVLCCDSHLVVHLAGWNKETTRIKHISPFAYNFSFSSRS